MEELIRNVSVEMVSGAFSSIIKFMDSKAVEELLKFEVGDKDRMEAFYKDKKFLEMTNTSLKSMKRKLKRCNLT